LWDINVETGEDWYSQRLLDIFQFQRTDVPKDLRWDLLIHPEDREAAQLIEAMMTRKVPLREISLECRFQRRDGEYIWVLLRAKPMPEGDGPPVRIVGVTSDITGQKKAARALAYKATHDSLTGLPNRYLLEDRIRQYIAQAKRQHLSFIMAVADLDDFKQVNDTLGHLAGDALLIEFGKRLGATARQDDTVARLGGDEFVCVYTCAPDKERETAERIMERLYASFKEPVDLSGTPYYIRSSIGLSFCPLHTDNEDKIFELADAALYRAKEKGKNTYTIWE
jgi:diguanylate cyclase (GGDEF)-like protein/PAS domain S-box-containing protein